MSYFFDVNVLTSLINDKMGDGQTLYESIEGAENHMETGANKFDSGVIDGQTPSADDMLGERAVQFNIRLHNRRVYCTCERKAMSKIAMNCGQLISQLKSIDGEVVGVFTKANGNITKQDSADVKAETKTVKESNAKAGSDDNIESITRSGSTDGVVRTGVTTSCGTTNGEFKALNTLITDDQSWYSGNHQGTIKAPDEATQKYLYNLAEATGMDYALLLGLWCSESTASVSSSGHGGTFGLTNKDLINIINTGNNDGNKNNYKEAINNVISSSYKAAFGTDAPASAYQYGSVYYDAAVAIVELNVMSTHWMGGGSCNVNTTWQAYSNYTGGFHRAAAYAASIRENLGWDAVDYYSSMSSTNIEGNFTLNLDW